MLWQCTYFVSSKDVRLPIQLQRAMAAEAEAAREARAKVCLTYYFWVEGVILYEITTSEDNKNFAVSCENDHELLYYTGGRSWRRTEGLAGPEGSGWRHGRVPRGPPAPLLTDPQLNLRRKELDHHLPSPHQHALTDDEEVNSMKGTLIFGVIYVTLNVCDILLNCTFHINAMDSMFSEAVIQL